MGNAYRSVLALKPTGDAVPANVLAGKTFSNADGTGKTGTMVNNGAVSITLTDQDPTYTIPEGYHNGGGVVGFSASGGDGADLIVTCDPVFAGTTISCTDGTTTYTKTCPSSSPYEVTFQSIPVGTWTISGSYSGATFSTIFTVLDFEAELIAIPEGSTVTPINDIQTWLHCGNIWDKTYTTISQILADANTLQSLIASNNAVDYMVRSKSWSSTITANASAMSYIGLNDYCADTLLADTTWRGAICSSAYFENVLNVKIPTMTSATAPSGEVTGSSPYPGWDIWGCVSGRSGIQGSTLFPQASSYWQYEFDAPVACYLFTVSELGDSNQINPSAMFTSAKIQGSNDGSTFTDLYNISQTPASGSKYDYNFVNATKYKYYRLANITGSYSGYLELGKLLNFYGRA